MPLDREPYCFPPFIRMYPDGQSSFVLPTFPWFVSTFLKTDLVLRLKFQFLYGFPSVTGFFDNSSLPTQSLTSVPAVFRFSGSLRVTRVSL